MVPLHVWLPEAHPAAPSPVSALLSGVMLKTAIYGLVRVIYDLIGVVRWEWGLIVLVIGAADVALRRAVRADAARSEAPARLSLGREHRHHPDRLRAVDDLHRHRPSRCRRARSDRRRSTTRSTTRSSRGCCSSAQARSCKRPGLRDLNDMGGLDPLHAAHRALLPGRGARDLGAAAAERLRLGVAHVPGGAAGAAAARAASCAASCRSSPPCSRSPARSPRCASSRSTASPSSASTAQRVRADAPRESEPLGARRHGMARRSRASRSGSSRCAMIGELEHGAPSSLLGSGLRRRGARFRLAVARADASARRRATARSSSCSSSRAVFGLTFSLVRRIYHGRLRRAPPWDCGFPEQNCAHAGHGGRVRPADPPDLRAGLSDRAARSRAPTTRSRVFKQEVEDRHLVLRSTCRSRAAPNSCPRTSARCSTGASRVYLLYSFVTLIALLVFVR